MLVNESHPLPEDYIPEDLISLYSLKNRSFLMRPVPYLLNREAAKALNDMCLAAKKERGFEIVTDHAYRTRKDQELVYRTDVSGCTAKPGCSEHETGNARDNGHHSAAEWLWCFADSACDEGGGRRAFAGSIRGRHALF